MATHDNTYADELIDAAARKLLSDEREAMVEHPAVEDLVAYQEARLPADRVAEIRRHLAVCAECVDDVHGLAAFDRPVEPAPTTEAENERSWQTLQQRLAASPEPARFGSAAAPAVRPRARLEPWLLAAGIVLAVSGGAAWWMSLQQAPAPAPSWRNPLAFPLSPVGEDRTRDVTGMVELEVPPDVDVLVATLQLSDLTPHEVYHVEILDPDGFRVFEQRGLRRDVDGTFTLLIPRLPPNTYALYLFGGDERALRRLASYAFRIRDGD